MDFKTKYSNCRHNFGITRPVARRKHEAGQSMCAVKNVLFHFRKLINFTMSLCEIC